MNFLFFPALIGQAEPRFIRLLLQQARCGKTREDGVGATGIELVNGRGTLVLTSFVEGNSGLRSTMRVLKQSQYSRTSTLNNFTEVLVIVRY